MHFVAAALWTLLLACLAYASDRELIGWLGETYTNPDHKHWLEVLSWEPRISHFHGLLTPEECDELIKAATPRLQRSIIAVPENGSAGLSEQRTSNGMFFTRGENDLIKRIEQRLAAVTQLPAENGEGIQVLRYELTQKYDAHHDYFSFPTADLNGGNRMATVLMYLAVPEEGGETVFPKVPAPAQQGMPPFSPCAMQGLAVRPKKGDAVLFWSIKPDGRFDVKSMHGSCPVIKGTKWSATKWIHVGRYAMPGEQQVEFKRVIYAPPPPPATPGCINKFTLCEHWAISGECEGNPSFMIGVPGRPGNCILACNRCDVGPNELTTPV